MYYIDAVKYIFNVRQRLKNIENEWPEQQELIPIWLNQAKKNLINGPRHLLNWPKTPKLYIHFTTFKRAEMIKKDGFLEANLAPNGFGAYAYSISSSYNASTMDRYVYKNKKYAAIWFTTDAPAHGLDESRWNTNVRIRIIKITSAKKAYRVISRTWIKNNPFG